MITDTKTVSVIIPLYNKAAHIVRTVDSILAQTVQPYEIIIVDDGSTDGGADRIERERGAHIRVVRQRNAGVSAARNRGIALASAEYIAFLDADDQWEPHYLEAMFELVEAFPAADTFAAAYQYAYGDGLFVDPKIRFPDEIDSPMLMDNFFEVGAKGDLPCMVSSILVRHSAIEKIGLFPEGEAMGEDQDFLARAALHSPIAYTPSVLLFYHQDADNRACVRHIPERECPFSERLTQRAETVINNPRLRQAMLDYCGAHILHLASLNARMGRVEVARRLLSDSRARRHGLRFLFWSTRTLLAGLRSLPLGRKLFA